MAYRTARKAEELADVEKIDVSKLLLDSRNPRLAELGLSGDESQQRILEVMWQEMAVDELVYSIAANGYFRHEPLFAAKKGSKYVVVEGNRRLAAVMLLLDAGLRKTLRATGLPKAPKHIQEQIRTLPVVVTDRESIWSYLGFKHVNGPQPWDAYAKAHYIARVHNEQGVPLDDIAETIGDRHATVKRLYRGLMALEQAERVGVFDRNDRLHKRFAFSHLYTALDYPGFQKFLGIDPEQSFKKAPVPKRCVEKLGEVLLWLYGSRSRDERPAVQTQNPDLKRLDTVLRSKDAVAALRQHVPLLTALDISKGDEQLFREALVQAKRYLEAARGKVLHGYKGEIDLVDTAESIADLIGRLLEEMQDIRKKLSVRGPRKR